MKATTIQTAINALSMARTDVLKLMSDPPTEDDKYWIDWVAEIDDALIDLKQSAVDLWKPK